MCESDDRMSAGFLKSAISGSSLNGRRLIRPQGLSLAVLQTKFGLLLGISKHNSLSMSRNLTYLVPNDFYSTQFSAFGRLKVLCNSRGRDSNSGHWNLTDTTTAFVSFMLLSLFNFAVCLVFERDVRLLSR